MPTDPENNNDRKTAIQIAQAQSDASVAVAFTRAATDYGVALVETNQIVQESAIQVQARTVAAQVGVQEILAGADTQVATRYYQANAAIFEVQSNSTTQRYLSRNTAAIESQSTYDESVAQVAVIYGESADRVRADVEQSRITASGDNAIAVVEADATSQVSEANVQQAIGQADARVLETQGVSSAQVAEISQTAAIEAAETLHAATVETTADGIVASIRHATTIEVANLRSSATVYSANRQSDGTKLEADSRSRLTVSGADLDGRASGQVATDRAADTTHSADDRYLEVVAREGGEDARLAAALTYADIKFREVYPLIVASVQADPAVPATPGLMAPWPTTPIRGVLTPRMVQMEVNRGYSRADSGFATGFLSRLADASGRGLSANSPHLDGYRAVLANDAVRAGSTTALTTRIGAAKQTADRITEGQSQRAKSIAARNRTAVASEGNAIDRQVGLLDGVATIISGLT